jgi:hypothetical protein
MLRSPGRTPVEHGKHRGQNMLGGCPQLRKLGFRFCARVAAPEGIGVDELAIV